MTLAFIVPGGFAFAPGGRDLYESQPAVQQACDDVGRWTGVEFPAVLDVDLTGHDFTRQPEGKTQGWARQVALTFGVVDVLSGLGMTPDAIAGTSMGTTVAAALAGSITREDVCGILAHHDGTPTTTPDGRELATAELRVPPGVAPGPYVEPSRRGLFLAAESFGAPDDDVRVLTVSGYADAMDDLEAEMAHRVAIGEDDGTTLFVYRGGGGAHCPPCAYMRDHMAPFVDAIDFRDPSVPLFSARVHGQRLTADDARTDILKNDTDFVSALYLQRSLHDFGVTLGLTVSGMGGNRFDFPVIEVDTPDDVQRAAQELFELGVGTA